MFVCIGGTWAGCIPKHERLLKPRDFHATRHELTEQVCFLQAARTIPLPWTDTRYCKAKITSNHMDETKWQQYQSCVFVSRRNWNTTYTINKLRWGYVPETSKRNWPAQPLQVRFHLSGLYIFCKEILAMLHSWSEQPQSNTWLCECSHFFLQQDQPQPCILPCSFCVWFVSLCTNHHIAQSLKRGALHSKADSLIGPSVYEIPTRPLQCLSDKRCQVSVHLCVWEFGLDMHTPLVL